MCKEVILDRQIDLFYALYSQEKTSKALWLSWEKNHKADVVRHQHFATANFLHFQLVDPKPIVQQIEQFHPICCEITLEGISLQYIYCKQFDRENSCELGEFQYLFEVNSR